MTFSLNKNFEWKLLSFDDDLKAREQELEKKGPENPSLRYKSPKLKSSSGKFNNM